MAGVKGRSGSGGARPGAGPKTKREKFESAIAIAERRLCDRLPVIIDSLIDLATGVKVLTDDGEVYQRAPDLKAVTYALDRIMGKPGEREQFSDLDCMGFGAAPDNPAWSEPEAEPGVN